MSTPRRVVIVGAGLAGSRCAETLRAEGFDGSVVIVGEEPLPPYERPALSKELLAGTRDADDLGLRPEAFWAQAGIVLRLGTRLEQIEPRTRTATLAGGFELEWDALVVATGTVPRTLRDTTLPRGVHTLRTLADALRLREELTPGARLAIVGAGFVGTEVASTAVGLGLDVTLIDAAPPFERLLGKDVSQALVTRYRDHGVELRLGAGVTGLRADGDGRVRAVHLDGAEVACDAVLLAIGATPATQVLPGATASGIDTDAFGQTAIPGIYACGDVARTWHPRLGAPVRNEHWTSAAGQGAAVARSILGRAAPYAELPYFWSDQFGLRLQMVGHGGSFARVELDGGPDSFLARYVDETSRPVAALAANRPREIGELRRQLFVPSLAKVAA